MDLTVGIINHNNKELLRRCLISIFEHTINVNFDCVVADNNSSDGSIDMLRKEFPKVMIIENHENLGFSRAVNQVIRRSDREFIFVCNQDIFLKENSFLKMLYFMQTNPRIAILGPKIINEEGALELSFNKKCSNLIRCFLDNVFFYSFLRTKISERYLERFLKLAFNKMLNNPQPVGWLSGAAFLLRRQATQSAGLMDEKFFLYYEDEDFCCRMNKAGWLVYYFPKTFIIHSRGKTIHKTEFNCILESTKSQVNFYRKRYKPTVLLLIKFLILYRLSLELLPICLISFIRPALRKKLQYYMKTVQILPTL
ncbi:MAG: glycosyltransferase family 2 protein [Candidatus Omnitrophota bacterium]